MFNFFKKVNDKITFIFGVPRSGTTWLWSMLESSNQVEPFLINVEKDSDGLYDISETAVYKKHKKAKRLIQKFANKFPDQRIVEKTPYHVLLFDKILRDFPKSKNILILRHPISIVNSMINSKMNAFRNHDVEKSVLEVQKYYRSIYQLIKCSNVYVIFYECLIDNTQYELSKLFDFLDLDTADIENIVKENSKRTKVKVQGLYRKGEKSSYEVDLTVNTREEISLKLVKEIEFYEKQFSIIKS